MIAITFALAEESKDLRGALRHASWIDDGKVFLGTLGRVEVTVIHTGVGMEAAARSVRAYLSKHHPAYLISAGYAGGLDPKVELGDLVVPTNVASAPLLEACRNYADGWPGLRFGELTTQRATVETIPDKQRLYEETKALAVDMETAAIREVCEAMQVPMMSVRGISDTAHTALPVPFGHWFSLARQRPRPAGLIRYLIVHPQKIVPFVQFVGALPEVRTALTDFLCAWITRGDGKISGSD